MTKKFSRAATQHALATCRLFTLAAIWAIFFTLGFQSPVIADETDGVISTPANAREIAAREVQLARETVEEARSATVSAKIQLEDFIARHFDDHHLRGATPLPKFRESRPGRGSAVNPQLDQLNQQLNDLKTRRADLLTRLTPVHPDILEVDERIAVLSQRLALEHPPAEEPAAPGAAEGLDAADGNLGEYLSSERARHQQSASAYAKLVARCQTAERDLQAALEAEGLAAQRLAEIGVSAAPMPSPSVNSLPTPAATPSGHVAKAPRQGSQPLALAVLLIALAVAALAAVKLARSSTDAVFANAAEVSAVLAVPVVGIIPAAEMASHELPAAGRLRRGTRLLAEVLLALAVFIAVAYLVQNPLSIWRICTDPMDGLSRMSRFFWAN
jgi:hypothetical protein